MKNEKTGLVDNNLSEIKHVDPELVQMVKFALPPTQDVPDWVEENVMNAYRKKYRYKIFYRKLKRGVTDFADSIFGHGRGLEIALASLVVLLFLGGITYYQYIKPQKPENTNMIVDKQPPTIKVTPTLTNTPIATPSPIQTINNPDIAKSSKNNSSKNIKGNGTVKNKYDKIIKNQKSNNDIENNVVIDNKIKNNTTNNHIENDVVVDNKIKNNDISNDIEDISRAISVKDVELLDMKTIYISSLGQNEEDKKLRENLNSKFSVVEGLKVLKQTDVVISKPNGIIKKEKDVIKIVSGLTDKLMWEISIKDFQYDSSEDLADKIVNKLLEDISKTKNRK